MRAGDGVVLDPKGGGRFASWHSGAGSCEGSGHGGCDSRDIQLMNRAALTADRARISVKLLK